LDKYYRGLIPNGSNMEQTHKVQCDSKLLMVDNFEVNQVSVQVFVLNTKKDVKQYCKDTELDFRKGLYHYYNPNWLYTK